LPLTDTIVSRENVQFSSTFASIPPGSSAIIKELELKTEDIYGEFAQIVAKQLDETLAEVQRTVAPQNER
jgi:hypothetical protein